jgi:hypothetical protein
LVESGVKASQGLMGSHAGGLNPSHPSHMQKWPPGPACKWVLCGSALDSREKVFVQLSSDLYQLQIWYSK